MSNPSRHHQHDAQQRQAAVYAASCRKAGVTMGRSTWMQDPPAVKREDGS
jgi:hypothetical protein